MDCRAAVNKSVYKPYSNTRVWLRNRLTLSDYGFFAEIFNNSGGREDWSPDSPSSSYATGLRTVLYV